MKEEVYKPLISLIMPSFNAEAFIAEALDSVLLQSYVNWECLIIDDHSSDSTLVVIAAYHERFPDQIKYFINPKKGAPSARNYGLEMASGKYVKFLDADDALFDTNTLADQLDFIQQNNLDIVYGVEHYYQDNFDDANLIKKRGAVLNDNNINSYFFKRVPITSNFFYKVPEHLKPRWNEELRSGQEFHFLFCNHLNGLKFGFQDKPAAKIRVHNSVNRVSNKSANTYADQTAALIKQLDLEMNNSGFDNQVLFSSLNFYKLRASLNALRIKNYTAFNSLQAILPKYGELKFPNVAIKLIYTLNSISPYLAFLFYKSYIKITKRDVLNGEYEY